MATNHLPVNRIENTDALTYLQSLPSESVHCMVTSPPYWGLRDYQVAGQLGLETTLTEYLDKLTAIFAETRRVLRSDGVMFVNMGDGYVSTNRTLGEVSNHGSLEGLNKDYQFGRNQRAGERSNLKPKDLIGQPWRLAFRLQDDGWFLRSDIIWHKPNPMPESVTDRPTKSHEYIFLLTKSACYWYDSFSVREKHSREWWDETVGPEYMTAQQGRNDGGKRKGKGNPAGRNKRSVWTVATQPYSAAHFATFPPKLIEPMILAGCPPKVCSVCGAPWERVVEPSKAYSDYLGKSYNDHTKDKTHGLIKDSTTGSRTTAEYNHTGWQPTCDHTDAPIEPGIVLDMFMGAGTTALVAIQHGRRWMGCELNADYIELAMDRISAVQVDMFTSVGINC